MSRPRFLADNDFNDQILRGAERQEPSLEIVRVRHVGLERRSDAEILDYAAEQRLLVLSHDSNTMTAAAADRIRGRLPFLAVFIVAQHCQRQAVIDDLILIWTASELEEWQNEIRFLPI
jgi:predicted nuclease of predicted toxin-antitoxin system